MSKFGKKMEIQLNPLAYNIGLLGESGIGKSTIMKEICEKLVGPEGYIALDIGREDGHKAINGIISEPVEDWSKFVAITDDIVENKDADYPELKVVIVDTYDQLFELAEKEAVRKWNAKNPDKRAETVNGIYGGFGRGLDVTIDMVLDRLWELKKVGVSFVIIAHTKKKDIDDPISGQSYSILTSNISQRYFNAIKTKLDFLGMAYIDRDIVKEKTGKKNLKTGEDIIKGKIVGESRVIRFRDDTYSVDSKSRFADIVDSIPFDADAFIKAMQDAILAEQSKSGVSLAEAKKRQDAVDKEKTRAATEYSKGRVSNKVDEDRNDVLIAAIKQAFTSGDGVVKDTIKNAMAENGVSNFKNNTLPTTSFEAIAKAANLKV
mgnify:CR=1 FL=1